MAMFAEMDLITLVQAAAVFGLVLSLWLMLMLVFLRRSAARRQELRNRLDAYQAQSVEARQLRLWHESGEVVTTVEDERAPSFIQRLRMLPVDANWSAPPLAIYGGVILLGLAIGFGMFLLTNRLVPSALCVGLVGVGFSWWANVCIARRESQFERQLIDALELCARALRAGHPLIGSFELISDEIPEPVGVLFGEVCQQQQMGVSLEDAVRAATVKSRNTDMKLLSASLAINMRSGGNLADVVDGIARVVRDRIGLRRPFKVLISQTQFSKRILLAMPVIMFFVLNLINPEYMSRLYDETIGNFLLAAAGGGMLLGWWVMNKMSVLRY